MTLATLILQNFEPAWFWLLLAAGAAASLVAAYRTIQRRTGRRLAWGLMAMRLIAIALLFAALLKPVWQRTQESAARPLLAVMVDDSQSMSMLHRAAPANDPDTDAADDNEHRSRYALARRWLDETDAGRTLRQRFDVELFNADGARLDGGLPNQPIAERTDLIRGLRRVEARMRGRSPAGVVLISDGRQTVGRSDYLTLSDYAMPVMTVGYERAAVGEAAYDLSVVSVDAPRRVLVHNEVTANVRLRKDAGPAVDLPLRIERGDAVLASEPVRLERGRDERVVNMRFTPDQPGDFVLTARAPAAADERSAMNNEKLFKLRVEAEPIRVLYIEGTLRSEHQFLRRRLAADPDVDLASFVRAASPRTAAGVSGAVGERLITADRLDKMDAVLLGDFEAAMLSDTTYHRLRDWVEQGGGLMVLGGYRNLSPAGLGATALADALPVRLDAAGVGQIDQPFRFELTPAGRRHPALTITGDMARDAELWASLPPLRGVAATGPARPGATVLARHPRANPASDDGAGYPVLAVQRFGRGVAALIAADTTWRWSRLPRLAGRTDALYARFWSQIVRALAQRPIDSKRNALMLSTDSEAYDRGQRVGIIARRNPAAMVPGQAGEAARLELTVDRPDGATVTLHADPDPEQPDAWRANYFPDRGGRFEVDARLLRPTAEGTRTLANQRTAFMVRGAEQELADPSTDPTFMRRIARLTGGTYAEINNDHAATAMIDRLPDDPVLSRRVRVSQLWHSPLLFIAFLAMLSAEWYLRRRHQLT